MSNLASDSLRRLEQLLSAAKDEYNTLDFIILECPVQVTYHSLKRSVTVPISGEDVGHLNALLAEAVLNRIKTLEKQIVEAHNQVVVAADEHLLDEDQLATYRQQGRGQQRDNPPADPLHPLASSTQAISDEHSP
jgi:hypothetical protein